MNAIESRKIFYSALRTLFEIESKWSRCTKCTYNGICCVGAPISLYPEEWIAIKDILDKNNALALKVKSNFERGRICSFYDSTLDKCSIYEQRPILCHWTPYCIFNPNNSDNWIGFVKTDSCKFISLENIHNLKIEPIIKYPYIMKITGDISEPHHSYYIYFQALTGLRDIQVRNDEFERIDTYLSQYYA